MKVILYSNDIELFRNELKFRYEPETLNLYQKAVEDLLMNCGKSVERVTAADIRVWLNELEKKGDKTSTRNTRLSGVITFFRFCLDEGIVQVDPTKTLSLAKVEDKLPQYLNREQMTRFRELVKDDFYYRAIMETLYATGVRIGELVDMRKEDINWSERSIHIPDGKLKKARIVLFTRDCEVTLRVYLNEREDNLPYVFLNTSWNGPLCKRTVQKQFTYYGKELGFRITPHSLRHTFAAQLAMKGMPLSGIQVLLGHAEAHHTQIYSRLYEHARKAIYDEFM